MIDEDPAHGEEAAIGQRRQAPIIFLDSLCLVNIKWCVIIFPVKLLSTVPCGYLSALICQLTADVRLTKVELMEQKPIILSWHAKTVRPIFSNEKEAIVVVTVYVYYKV